MIYFDLLLMGLSQSHDRFDGLIKLIDLSYKFKGSTGLI